MPPLDLNEQAQQLRSLARGFEELHDRVRDLAYSPGTDGLHQITPLLDGCSPWACRSEVEAVQDDFGLVS